MANVVVVKSGDVVEVVSNDILTHYSKISQNMVTGLWVGLRADNSCIDGNLILLNKIAYKVEDIDSINGISITTIDLLYSGVKSLL